MQRKQINVNDVRNAILHDLMDLTTSKETMEFLSKVYCDHDRDTFLEICNPLVKDVCNTPVLSNSIPKEVIKALNAYVTAVNTQKLRDAQNIHLVQDAQLIKVTAQKLVANFLKTQGTFADPNSPASLVRKLNPKIEAFQPSSLNDEIELFKPQFSNYNNGK